MKAAPQIPVLCGSCGGAVDPREDFSLVCPYCDAVDRLPENELDRVLELKRRVRAAANSAAQLRGVEAALSSMYEGRGAFVRLTAPYLAIAGIVLAYSFVSAWPIISSAAPEHRVGFVIQSLMGTSFIMGMALSLAVALLVGRVRYRRSVRPLLFARPPRAQGQPTRCRACGGDLPDQKGPFIRCPFCDTHNLVTPQIQRDRERLLAQEEQFHRSRASRAVSAASRGSMGMTGTLVLGIVISYAAMIGLSLLAGSLFGH